MQKWSARFFGFVVAVALFVLVAFVIFAILSDLMGHQMVPRGAGWLFVPIVVGIAGARYAEASMPRWIAWARSPHGTLKYFLAGGLVWVAAIWCYLFIFNPFGSYWSSSDWSFVWKLMLTPIAFAALCGLVLNWIRPRAS